MSPGTQRWLARLYSQLRTGPLPGQSNLDVQPHPLMPDAYTVPFLTGHIVFAVPPNKGVIGMLAYIP